MDSHTASILSFAAYKITALLVGLVGIVLGYRLFAKGIWGDAGTFRAEFQNKRLLLRNAAPGTFFALFGTAVVIFTLGMGFKIEQQSSQVDANRTPSESRHQVSTEPTFNPVSALVVKTKPDPDTGTVYEFPGASALPTGAVGTGLSKDPAPEGASSSLESEMREARSLLLKGIEQ